MVKKLALLLFGISYKEEYKHWSRKCFIINYKNSIDNYRKYLISYFKKQNYDVDIFISTYDNHEKDNIIRDYSPKSYIFTKNFVTNMHMGRNLHFLNCLNLCIGYANENNINYDLVIMTRFDLLFKIPFEQVRIDYDTLNLVSVLERSNLIDDNFYIFPYEYIDNMKNIVKLNNRINMHYVKDHFVKIFKRINYLKNDHCFVKDLTFFDINRENI